MISEECWFVFGVPFACLVLYEREADLYERLQTGYEHMSKWYERLPGFYEREARHYERLGSFYDHSALHFTRLTIKIPVWHDCT